MTLVLWRMLVLIVSSSSNSLGNGMEARLFVGVILEDTLEGVDQSIENRQKHTRNEIINRERRDIKVYR